MPTFDTNVTALASSARAVLETFTVTGDGGSPPIPGLWTEVKSDMEQLLPGAIVAMKGAMEGETIFGLIPTTGALGMREGRLRVKISKDGTTTGAYFNSDGLASSVNGIWLGAVSGVPTSVNHFKDGVSAEVNVVPGTDSRFRSSSRRAADGTRTWRSSTSARWPATSSTERPAWATQAVTTLSR